MNEILMQLIEEDNNPEEMFLEDIVEEAVEKELDILYLEDDIEDEIIRTINDGIRYDDAIDFTDADVNSAVFDDLTDDNDD